jgi:hypothetical protein
MKGRLQAVILTSTAQRASQVSGFLENRLDAKGSYTIEGTIGITDTTTVNVTVDFDVPEKAREVLDEIVTEWLQRTYILAGSWVGWHECRHDEGQIPCVITFQVTK